MDKEQEVRLKQAFLDIVDHMPESDLDIILEEIKKAAPPSHNQPYNSEEELQKEQ